MSHDTDDLPEPIEADMNIWSNANTLDELCELGAQFVEGKIGYYPGWDYGDVYQETVELRGVLASLNRRGFFTYMSQPGDIPLDASRKNGKRPFVSGFMNVLTADNLQLRLQCRGVLILVYRPHDPAPIRFIKPNESTSWECNDVVVRLDDGVPTFFVGDDRNEAYTRFGDCFARCSSALWELGSAAFVVVFGDWGQHGLFELVDQELSDINAQAEMAEAADEIGDTTSTGPAPEVEPAADVEPAQVTGATVANPAFDFTANAAENK